MARCSRLGAPAARRLRARGDASARHARGAAARGADDESLPGNGPGAPRTGTSCWAGSRLRSTATPLASAAARADYARRASRRGALDDDPRSGWAIGGGEGAPHALVSSSREPLVLARERARAHARAALRRRSTARTRAPRRGAPPPALEPVPAPEVEPLLARAEPARTSARAGPWYAERSPAPHPMRARRAAIDASSSRRARWCMQRARRAAPHLRAGARQLPRARRRRSTPGVPAVLPQLPAGDARATRLDLARWLVSRRTRSPRA
jgi:hypothetical protein